MGWSCKISKLRDLGMTGILIAAVIGVMLNAPIPACSKGIVTHATITVYHPVKSQTDDSPMVTAGDIQAREISHSGKPHTVVTSKSKGRSYKECLLD